ncbi:MAG: hypothetical protein JSU70_10535 [Phycisphaerales bacterium]|nr:MAG: hypothetical protein JSU70_10535 [Phycisphaerales bacterium]
MVLSIDIRRVKRESYRIIRQDGLSDICAGLMLGIMALFFFDFRYAGALIVGCAMQTVLLPACRRGITYPRVGYVKFPGRSDGKSLLLWDIALPLIVVGLIICIGIWVRQLLPVCLGTFLAGLALPAARITRYTLDYIFVGLFFVSGVVGQLVISLGCDPAIAAAYQLWGLSGILVSVGAVELVCFLRKYPSPVVEVSNDTTN